MEYINKYLQRALNNKADWSIQVERTKCSFCGMDPNNTAFYDVTFKVAGHEDLTIVIHCGYQGFIKDKVWVNSPLLVNLEQSAYYTLIARRIEPDAVAKIKSIK
jgi:hypothetical protein